MKKTHPIAIRMDPEIKGKLEKLAAKDARSLSSYVGVVLAKHVQEAEARPARAK
jgi:predicted DNA-binding protein